MPTNQTCKRVFTRSKGAVMIEAATEAKFFQIQTNKIHITTGSANWVSSTGKFICWKSIQNTNEAKLTGRPLQPETFQLLIKWKIETIVETPNNL